MLARRSPGLLLLLSVAYVFIAPAYAQPAVPDLTGRVVDRAEILAPGTEQTLTDMLARHEQATSNQVVVLTVPTLARETVEAAALRLFNTWGLGQADLDNGVLVLIARDEREMRIEVGYGLEGTLTDSRAGRIIRNEFVPDFRDGDFDGGTLAGVNAVIGTLEGTYAMPPERSSQTNRPPLFVRLIFGGLFGLMPLLAFAPTFFLAGRWGGLVFVGVFLLVGSGLFFFSILAVFATLGLYVATILVAEQRFRRLDDWEETRAEVAKTLDENEGRRVEVNLGGYTMTVGGVTQGGGSGGSGGGFSSGGGGFSGGGGSSGGGGASGGW